MATLTTKYSMGNVVYLASTTTERRQRPCPDCFGSREWEAKSPAGGVFAVACPRCAARYSDNDSLSLSYTAHAPVVTRLTVGSIRVNTSSAAWDAGAQYMAVETGVGSGSVYREDDLFPSEAEALVSAKARALSADQSIGWVSKQYDRAVEISDYQLESAALKNASDAAYRARSMLYGIGSLFDEIADAADKDAILELIADYRKYDWATDKAKADAVEPSSALTRATGG